MREERPRVPDPIRVALLGTGHMGAGIGRLALERPGLALVGAYARRAARAGSDLGPALGLDRSLGLAIRADLPGLLDEARPDVVIQATCSRLDEAEEELAICLARGVDTITIAEEVAWPWAYSPACSGSWRCWRLPCPVDLSRHASGGGRAFSASSSRVIFSIGCWCPAAP